MKIGNVKLKNNVFLAPMAGITDLPFRLLCKREGCGVVYTEMITAKGIYYRNEKTHRLLQITKEEKPTAVQIFGSEPQVISSIIPKAEKTGASIIDINMGCPTPKIVKNGDGSALMLKPKLAGEIIKAAVQSSELPVTVKIRKGWDDTNVNAVEIAKIAEENGAKAITVHGRTRQQFYSGKADWDIIKKVKENVNIPVIGNGDIIIPQDAEEMFKYTQCDGIMIGRAACGSPWIFKRVIHYLETGELLPEPDITQKVKTMKEHIQMLIEYKGEYIAIREARKHVGWYVKGIKNAARIKDAVNKVNSIDGMEQLLSTIVDYT